MRAPLAFVLCVAALLGPCTAVAVDMAQPVSIRADSIQLNQRTGISTYTGHVHLVQAGMTIRAQHIEVVSAHGHVLSMHGYGNPLRMEDAQPGRLPIFGRALRMAYSGANEELTLIGHVHFRQGANSLQGHMIHYYTATQRVVAIGAPGHRVSAVIVPHTLHSKSPKSPKS
ncbi:MAG: lipopolysaccharide transport periplasmic protein LptA [Gammaproteobacteria bacterium]|nr:lipopolysaccharide transport periplasmic protein LptA [Gammaproteobacteria bacterium]